MGGSSLSPLSLVIRFPTNRDLVLESRVSPNVARCCIEVVSKARCTAVSSIETALASRHVWRFCGLCEVRFLSRLRRACTRLLPSTFVVSVQPGVLMTRRNA